MKAIANFTLKSLRANRVRSLVTIAGVALAAALLTAVMTSYTSLNGFLYTSEKELTGEWMAEAHGTNAEQMKDHIDYATNNVNVSSIASLQDVGFGELSAKQQNSLGQYLPIASYTGDIEKLCAISPIEGRLPESADEIVLPSNWQTQNENKIGDTLTLNVGQRQAILVDPNGESTTESITYEHNYGTSNNVKYQEISEGSLLDSSIGYCEAKIDGGNLNEKLVNTKSMSFTIVGFISMYSYGSSTPVGQMGIIGSTSDAQGSISAYITFNNVNRMDDVEEQAEALFPDEHITYHTAMLRYLGVQGNSPIWDTFFGLVAVLSVVIITACVSLIYNAFAISVAERASQFGLLASIGASRRQLRRAVFIEGLAVALIGIPLGLLLGIGGCAITFHFIGPVISSVLSESTIPFNVTVAPWAIAFSSILTLVTVLISVFIPAWRVGKANPIEVLTQNRNGKASKRGIKNARTSTNSKKLWKRHGIVSRLFGMGGELARINTKRSKTKGRAASLSLALAIVLLMTAGSFNTFISTLVDAVDQNANYDIAMSCQLESDQGISEDIAFYEGAYNALKTTPGAEPKGWFLNGYIPMIIPDEMVSDEIKNPEINGGNAGYRNDGTLGAEGLIYYLDDESFNAFAKDIGIDPQPFYNPDNPQAISTNLAYVIYDGKYQQIKTLTNEGVVKALNGGEYNNKEIDGFIFQGWTSKDGEVHFEFVPYTMQDGAAVYIIDDAIDKTGAVKTLDLNSITTTDIDISCLSSTTPEIIGHHDTYVRLIMPMSVAAKCNFTPQNLIFTAAFNAIGTDHAETTERLDNAFTEYRQASGNPKVSFTTINDYLSEAESNHMIALVVNVFCLLFTAILTLIAMANVFNTVTNGLILRRREFAVMRSIGLSNKQFRSMIANECVNYALCGLIPGLIISVIISFLLYTMVGLSMGGITFTIPWKYMLLAIGLTLITMLASVAYGMHRCKADNVVEALRADSM